MLYTPCSHSFQLTAGDSPQLDTDGRSKEIADIITYPVLQDAWTAMRYVEFYRISKKDPFKKTGPRVSEPLII